MVGVQRREATVGHAADGGELAADDQPATGQCEIVMAPSSGGERKAVCAPVVRETWTRFRDVTPLSG